MASIGKVAPGQTLYTVTRQKAGNTTMARVAIHTVVVREVSPDGRFVLAAWNGNPVRKYFESQVAKWKVNKPAPKGPV